MTDPAPIERSSRLTIRRIMGIVLLVAIALGLVWPGIELMIHPRWHLHSYVVKSPQGTWVTVKDSRKELPHTRYWRKLTGRDPNEKHHCGWWATSGVFEEACSIEEPDVANVPFQPLPCQKKAVDRLNAAEIKSSGKSSG